MQTLDVNPGELIRKMTPQELYDMKIKEIEGDYEEELSNLNNALNAALNDEAKKNCENLINLAIKYHMIRFSLLPYYKLYFEWYCNTFSEISDNDYSSLLNTVNIPYTKFENIAVSTYLHGNYSQKNDDLYNKLYNNYKSTQEETQPTLDNEQAETFLKFLNLCFKPAMFELISDINSGKYRKKSLIYNDLNAATANKDDRTGPAEFIQELNKPKDDLYTLIIKYAKQNDFILLTEETDLNGEVQSKSLSKGDFQAENFQLDISQNIIDALSPKTARALYPNYMLMNSTKAYQNLHDIDTLDDMHGYIVSNKKSKKLESVVYVTLSADDETNLIFSKPIDRRDRDIINALETLAERNEYITPANIYRMMNGGTDLKVTAEQSEDIIKRIDYMRRIIVTVDYTDHMILNGAKEAKYILESHLLNLDKVTIKQNGKEVTAYKYIKMSPLMQYAKDVNQIVAIPSRMLDTASVQRNSDRAQNIKNYLLFRIYTIEKQGNIINLETILKQIGEPNPSTKQLEKVRNIIESLLEFWSYGKKRSSKSHANKEILNVSPIKGYSPLTKGRKVVGYELIPKKIAT